MVARALNPLPRALFRPAAAMLLVTVGAATSVATPESTPLGPRELIGRLGELEAAKRYGEILDLIDPEQRELYVFVSWFGAAFDAIGGEPEAVADYRAILSNHGLDEAWLSKRATGRDGMRRLAAEALRGVDLAGLLQDLAAFRREHGRFGVAFGFVGELRDLHVEEDWASARVGRSEFEFQRRDGAWSWVPFPEDP